jgi:hypothetical protein
MLASRIAFLVGVAAVLAILVVLRRQDHRRRDRRHQRLFAPIERRRKDRRRRSPVAYLAWALGPKPKTPTAPFRRKW